MSNLKGDLDEFFNSYETTVLNLTDEDLKIGQEMLSKPGGENVNRFDAPLDSLHFYKTIIKAMELNATSKEIHLVDLGAGNSMPSLLAIKHSPNIAVSTFTGVDVSRASLREAQVNLKKLNISVKNKLININLIDYLKEVMDKAVIVVSNPPYVPTTQEIGEFGKFTPVNGGKDGTYFLTKILNAKYPKGTTLALQWSSLTSPRKMILQLEKNIKIVCNFVTKIPFGTYTSQPEILDYLTRLKDNEESYFEVGADNKNYFWIISTVGLCE